MLGWINYIANASVTASSELAGFPVSNLKAPPLVTTWRSEINTASLYMDFGQIMPVDVLGLFGCNFGSGAECAVKMSAIALGNNEAFNRPLSLLSYLENDNGAKRAIILLPSPIAARYVQIDLVNPATPRIRVGLAWAGPLFRPQWGRSWGASNTQRSDTTTVTTRGGQVYGYKRPVREVLSFALDFLTDAEASGPMREMQKAVSIVQPVLAIFEGAGDPNTPFILGRLTAPLSFTRQSLDRQSVKLEIEELG